MTTQTTTNNKPTPPPPRMDKKIIVTSHTHIFSKHILLITNCHKLWPCSGAISSNDCIQTTAHRNPRIDLWFIPGKVSLGVDFVFNNQ